MLTVQKNDNPKCTEKAIQDLFKGNGQVSHLIATQYSMLLSYRRQAVTEGGCCKGLAEHQKQLLLMFMGSRL